MIQLNPMQESAFASHMALLIPDYAAEHVRNGRWTEAESLSAAQAELDKLLPNGL